MGEWLQISVSNQTPSVNAAAALATTTGAISAVIWQVPNQPCLFAADPKKQQRVEGETGLAIDSFMHL